MIALKEIVELYGDRDLFIHPEGVITYREFAEMVMEADGRHGGLPGSKSSGGTTSVSSTNLHWSVESFAGFMASLESKPATAICHLPISADLEPFIGHQPLLILQSGGTTGAPRHVVHSVERLLGRYSILDRQPTRNLVLYEADHIAGLDAFFQALHRGNTLVLPASRDAHGIVRAIAENEVEVLPATPTFLQLLLLSGALEDRSLGSVRTIPHGAEAMPHALRRRVEAAFPRARLVQRFGLSELGALPVRQDPQDPSVLILDAEDYAWKIEDDELIIKAPTRMLGTLEDGLHDKETWYRTGDLAELAGSAGVRILGRREALINVGGRKILPESVENFLLEQEGVLDVAVYGERSQLTGQALAADVVFEQDPVPALWLRSLRKNALASGLDLAHVPTHIRPVRQIQKSRTGKRLRRPGKA